MGNRCIYLYLSYNSCSRLFIFFISANLCICNMQIQFCILSKSTLMVIHGFSYETIKWIRSCSVLSILHYSYDCQATIKLNNVCLYIYILLETVYSWVLYVFFLVEISPITVLLINFHLTGPSFFLSLNVKQMLFSLCLFLDWYYILNDIYVFSIRKWFVAHVFSVVAAVVVFFWNGTISHKLINHTRYPIRNLYLSFFLCLVEH